MPYFEEREAVRELWDLWVRYALLSRKTSPLLDREHRVNVAWIYRVPLLKD